MTHPAVTLLNRLDKTLTCIHLDMGGKNKYMVGLKSQPVLRDIKLYLAAVDNHERLHPPGCYCTQRQVNNGGEKC